MTGGRPFLALLSACVLATGACSSQNRDFEHPQYLPAVVLEAAYADFVARTIENGEALLAEKMRRVDFKHVVVRRQKAPNDVEYLMAAAPVPSGSVSVVAMSRNNRPWLICHVSESEWSAEARLEMLNEPVQWCRSDAN